MVKAVVEKLNIENKPVRIFAADEGRFGRITNLGYAWAPKGVRPSSKAQIVREYTYAYTAVCPSTGESSSLILPYADEKCMSIFLDNLSQEFSEYFIVLQLDGAGSHKSKNLKIPNNIGIIYQPPYSPELNPVEHIWDEIKEKNFTNRIFNSMEEVTKKLSAALMRLYHDKSKLISMCNFPFYNFVY